MTENIDSGKIIYSVSELTLLIKETVETKFYSIWLKGEISGFKSSYASGYYFDLKDSKAKISSIIFKYDIQRLNFKIKEGLSVIAFGRINLYEPRGTYSFIISDIEPEGYGKLALAYEQLKEKLQNEGLFDKEHKRNIPFLPYTIGIVTSKSGAVLHDIVKIARRRFDNIHLIFANASVQGNNSSAEIANAIKLLNYYSKNEHKIDILIVGRGGGSLEDLWSFNEEKTAYAIYNSDIPVISAVGHETDFTIADFVADVRASTPSNAAEIAVPVKLDLLSMIKKFNERLKSAVLNTIKHKNNTIKYLRDRQYIKNPKKLIEEKFILIDDVLNDLFNAEKIIINNYKLKVNSLDKRLELRHPAHVLKDKYLRLKEIQTRFKLRHPDKIIKDYKIIIEKNNKILNDAMFRKIFYFRSIAGSADLNNDKAIKNKIFTDRNVLQLSYNTLQSISPYSVLKRGYSITLSETDKIISSITDVNINDKIKIIMNDGLVNSRVISKDSKINKISR